VQGGRTALHLASEYGHPGVAEVLLEKGGGADLAKIQDEVRLCVCVCFFLCLWVGVSISVC
jgi:hypothetical protein